MYLSNKEVLKNNIEYLELIKDMYKINLLDYDNILKSNQFIKMDLLTVGSIKHTLIERNIISDLSLNFIDNSNILITVNYIYNNDNEVYFINRLIDNIEAKLKTWNIIIKLDILTS